MKNKAEIWKALLDGKIVKSPGDSLVRLNESGETETHDGDDWCREDWSFADAKDWSIYEEPKRPRKALAFVDEGGGLLHVLSDSKKCQFYLTKPHLFERAEAFDIEEKTDSK